jgi:pimeloyl-ACP methyl ester carboxylesterase
VTRPVPHAGPHHVEANGVRLAYETFGDPDAVPLLLIMGLGMQMVAWDDDFCRMLARRGFHVIRFDNRDVGLSTWMRGMRAPTPREIMLGRMLRRPVEPPYRLEDMAADAVGLLDALDIRSAHVVGASLGGMIAQLMAIHYSERVRTLTCIMSRASGDRSGGRPTLRALTLFVGRAPRQREEYLRRAQQVWRVLSGPRFPPDPVRVRERAAAAWERGINPGGVRRHLAAEMTSASRVEALGRVRAPTLVIHGSLDPLLPPQGGRQIAAAVPGAELLILDGMGHSLPEPLWSRIVGAIARLARRVEGPETTVRAGGSQRGGETGRWRSS